MPETPTKTPTKSSPELLQLTRAFAEPPAGAASGPGQQAGMEPVRRSPLRVALVVMPFFDLIAPAIGVGQLASVVNERMPEIATVTTIYANHDLAELLGPGFHQAICEEPRSTGLGDWLFRQVAFPGLPDNSEEYLARYFAAEEDERKREAIIRSRPQLEPFCNDLIERYGLDRYDVVGFTSMFSQTVASLAVARLLKERRPEIVTLVGGANCEAPMGPALARNAEMIDYVFSGSSLRSFPKFLRQLAEDQGQMDARLPRGVFGATTPLTEANQFGDELPLTEYVRPDYAGFVEAFERTRPLTGLEPVMTFETSRGCWWGQRSHCTFCGLNGSSMGYRSMRPELALQLLQDLLDDYYPWCKEFAAVDNILPEEYPADVFPHFQAPADAGLFYEVRVKNLDRETLRDLARAGIRRVQPGIESVATSTLKLMRKGTTSFQNLRFLLDCLDFNIDSAWGLLVGFPGEDDVSYRHYLETIPLLGHVPPPGGVGFVRIDRYSPHFTKAEEYGLVLEPFSYYGLTFPFPAEDLHDLAYYFDDRGAAVYRETLEPYLPAIERAVAEWRESYYERQVVLAAEQQADGSIDVYDSRGHDAPLEYNLTGPAAGLLLKLHQPTRLDRLTATELEALAELDNRRLVFHDVGRALSLVSWGPDFTPSELHLGMAPTAIRAATEATAARYA